MAAESSSKREEVRGRAFVVYTLTGKKMTVTNVIGALSREDAERWKDQATTDYEAALWKLFAAIKFYQP
jgi:hypothetical protein